jgi:hypothetical protein
VLAREASALNSAELIGARPSGPPLIGRWLIVRDAVTGVSAGIEVKVLLAFRLAPR